MKFTRRSALAALAALAVAQLPYAAGTVLISVGFVQRDLRTMIGVTAVGLITMLILARIVQKRVARP